MAERSRIDEITEFISGGVLASAVLQDKIPVYERLPVDIFMTQAKDTINVAVCLYEWDVDDRAVHYIQAVEVRKEGNGLKLIPKDRKACVYILFNDLTPDEIKRKAQWDKHKKNNKSLFDFIWDNIMADPIMMQGVEK